MSDIQKAWNFTQRACSWAYRRTLRHLMPVIEPVRYAGVETDLDRKWGDSLVPRFGATLRDVPDYEAALVRGLNMYVKPGMTVVVIGGGIGVTAVIAAKLAGSEGKVICYEGSRINVDRIRETARRNGVSDQVQVNYGVVGPAIAVYHEDSVAPPVDIDELPECDVLEMDCEGSEKTIISELKFLPKKILVETHGFYGAPTSKINNLLNEKGYKTMDLGVASPRSEKFCMENDIRVIAAEHSVSRSSHHANNTTDQGSVI